MKVFPIFLNNLGDERSVVIGGGHEAERKAGDLLECDANVTVISPDVTDTLRQWAEDGAVTWLERDYQRGDLKDTFLVIVSETNPERTAPIWDEAQDENVLINAMDDVPHCNFVGGSIVRRGPLTFSISTSGYAPVLSVRLRQRFEEEFGPEYETFLHIMKALRPPMAAHYPDFDRRRDRWYELVDAGILELLREERYAAAHERIAEIVGDEVAAEAHAALRSQQEAARTLPAESLA